MRGWGIWPRWLGSGLVLVVVSATDGCAGHATGGGRHASAGESGDGTQSIGGDAGLAGNETSGGDAAASGAGEPPVGGVDSGGAPSDDYAGADGGPCEKDEYQEVGAIGCRRCTNWVYDATHVRLLSGQASFDAAAGELVVIPADGLPLPKVWSARDVQLADNHGYTVPCAGQAHFGVRDGSLVVDVSELLACAYSASGAKITLEFDGFSLDYGCAGHAETDELIFIHVHPEDGGVLVLDHVEEGPPKLPIAGAPEPPLAAAVEPSTCADTEYQEVGFDGCRSCGRWSYGYGSVDDSCRMLGAQVSFDAASGELTLEPGSDLPLPRSWYFDPWQTFFVHEDQAVVIPPCAAEPHTFMRGTSMIADLSEYQGCAASLPPGAHLELNRLSVSYGCAGFASARYKFDVPLNGGDSVVSWGCESAETWPPKRYHDLYPPAFPRIEPQP